MHYVVLAGVFVLALAVPYVFGTLSVLGSMTVFLLLLSWSISWRRGASTDLSGRVDRSSWIFWIMALVIAVLIPLLTGTPFFLGVMITFFIYLSWNLMWGLVLGTAGLQSFATVAIAGLAAYGAAFITVNTTTLTAAAAGSSCSGQRLLGLPVVEWYVGIVVAAIVGLVVGFLVSLPAIRLRGIYFALLTIGLVELVRAYMSQDTCNFGGAQGIYGASGFIPSDMMGSLEGYRIAYFAALGLAIVAALVYWAVNYGRLGLLLRTARESEAVAQVLGVDVVRARLWVFLISSTMLGVAGGFYTAYYKSISPSFFSFGTLLLLFAMIMIGGLNTPRGILIGTMLLTFVDRRFIDVSPPEARYVFIGLLLLVVTLIARDGLISIPDQVRRRREEKEHARGATPGGLPPEDAAAIEQESHMPPGSRPGTG